MDALRAPLTSDVMRLKPVIRSAVAQDAEQIAALGMQVWLHTYATAGVSREMAQYVLKEFTAAKRERRV